MKLRNSWRDRGRAEGQPGSAADSTSADPIAPIPTPRNRRRFIHYLLRSFARFVSILASGPFRSGGLATTEMALSVSAVSGGTVVESLTVHLVSFSSHVPCKTPDE